MHKPMKYKRIMNMTILRSTLAAILMMMLPTAAASAYDLAVDGIYYNVTDGQATVTNGGWHYCYSGNITIPDHITNDGMTYPVVAIDYRTFIDCEITRVSIPNSVKTIAAEAFYGCSSLTEINLPDSLTTIEKYTFSYCSGLTHITIPNSVKTIGFNAFFDCSRLTSIDMGDSVTSIEHGAFEHCIALTSINLPNTVTSIGYGAFYNCTSLTSFIIPELVTSIEHNTFLGCTSLTSITIPNAVTVIDNQAFRDCSNLDSITIGSGVTDIGSYILWGCSKLNNVTCLATTPPIYAQGLFENDDYYSQVTLHVPSASLEAYQSAYFWQDFYQILGDAVTGEDIPGDVNGDGDVTIADANKVIDVIINGGGSSGGHNHAPTREGGANKCDVNGDGETTISDLNAVIIYIFNH